MTKPAAGTPPPFPIVGIGASAGGVEALQAFFEALPEPLGVAFVVVIHLSPEYRSELATILARKTRIPVEEVSRTVALEADRVYVIPPDQRLQLTDTEVGAFPFEQPRGHRAPIDLFFRSLAEQYGDGFAVILSGSGSDGAVGVKAVKEQGGLILVQDPKETRFDGMPRAAIATGVADVVLPVRELAHRLAELVKSKQRIDQTLEAAERLKDDNETTFARILAHLRAKTGHDFSKYKRATVLRRLARRMQVHRKETLGSYHRFLREHVEEAQALFDELLISVTTFFRDPAAWEALREQVIPRLFEEQGPDASLRVWVPGCATGEEAYSMAILLIEEAERRSTWPKIQVFASDLDEGALATAREGCYPAAIEADVSEERLRRFFRRDDEHYRITGEVRDCILFANHSLLRDPPFSRLNLVSCRNLLIYLDPELQQQVLGILRYALCPGGYLFLGASERAEGEDFRALDKKHHIFQARQTTGQALKLPELSLTGPQQRPAVTHERPQPSATHRALLEDLAPPSILVDEQRNALHLSETVGRFLQPPGGPLARDITALVRPELHTELSAALYRSFEKNEASLSAFVPVSFDGMPRRVGVLVQPRRAAKDQERMALVVFLEGGEATPTEEIPAEGSASAARQLKEKLHQTQTRLRSSREDFEASNEELRAANEELQSLNEEYRSTAEELETSKEELQSVNEELQTVNNELKTKLEEISRAHSDLENLMAATEIGTLFLDRGLRIHRFTPPVTELFHIKSSDRNRSITDFTHRLDYEGLDTDAQNVLRDLVPIEREVKSQNGRWYLMRLRPYRTVDDRIDGVVITFVDITAHKQAEERLQQQAEQLREQDRYKNEFLGLLGHELRNPLTAISSVTELLRLDALPANEHRQAIELISDQVHHLRRLVDDLLNITRISRGQIALSKVPVNLAEVVAGAIDQVRPQIEARHHQLVRDLPERPLPVEADPERLTQIVANLLSNAAQYTEEHGRITVAVGETEDRACLRVRDTGIGFAPDEARRLFEPFTRLESPAGHRSAGLGLGLALASKLAELHGGRLEAASAGVGQGSEFTLWLPLLPEGQPLEPVQPSADPDTEIPSRRILLVEDDETVGYAMVQVLRVLGHEVRMVARGGQAAQAVQEFNPQLVLLDIGLPDMGGYEVARQLRQKHGSEAFRLVALTGYAQELDWQQAEAAGFDRYLLKPANIKDLQAVIKDL
jgi:two-component system CheB/CheR fusion protein